MRDSPHHAVTNARVPRPTVAASRLRPPALQAQAVPGPAFFQLPVLRCWGVPVRRPVGRSGAMVWLVFAQGRQPEQVAVAPADTGAVAANVASLCVRRPRFRHTAGWQQSGAVARHRAHHCIKHAHPATTCGTVQSGEPRPAAGSPAAAPAGGRAKCTGVGSQIIAVVATGPVA